MLWAEFLAQNSAALLASFLLLQMPSMLLSMWLVLCRLSKAPCWIMEVISLLMEVLMTLEFLVPSSWYLSGLCVVLEQNMRLKYCFLNLLLNQHIFHLFIFFFVQTQSFLLVILLVALANFLAGSIMGPGDSEDKLGRGFLDYQSIIIINQIKILE